MVATPTSVYIGEESLPIRGICTGYRGRPARAPWGQNNRSAASLQNISWSASSHQNLSRKTLGSSLTHDSFPVIWVIPSPFLTGTRLQGEVDVIQLVSASHNPSCFTLVTQLELAAALNSPCLLLTSSFSPENSAFLPSSPLSIVPHQSLYHSPF